MDGKLYTIDKKFVPGLVAIKKNKMLYILFYLCYMWTNKIGKVIFLDQLQLRRTKYVIWLYSLL